MDFLNRIVCNDEKLQNQLVDFKTVDNQPMKNDEVSSDIEFDEAIAMETNIDKEKSDENPYFDGNCFRCKSKVACVLFLNCKHLATCKECWDLFEDEHIENSHIKYPNNKRKLHSELKRRVCPLCKQSLSKLTPYSIINPTKF